MNLAHKSYHWTSARLIPYRRFKFIVRRLSKVPQPVGQKRALLRKSPEFTWILAGTIIAKIYTGLFEARLIWEVKVPFNLAGLVELNCRRQEMVMKSVAFLAGLLCALIIGSVSWGTHASNTARKQSAVTNFDRAVVLHGVTLKGQYLFVHDDAAMQRGEACTFVYEGNAPIPSKLVVSFHCVPVQRVKAKRFTVRSVETSPGITELQEYQFDGDTEGHAVPTSVDQHVNIKN